MAMLARQSSGRRHLRWGSEVTATVGAHLEENDELTPAQKEVLKVELGHLQARLTALDAVVKPYVAYVEGASLGVRARQRVANYLVDVPMKDATARVRANRRDVQEAVPDAVSRLTSGLAPSRALSAGHVATAQLARSAADVLALLAPRFAWAGPVADVLERRAARLEALNGERAGVDTKRAPLKLAVERATLDLREFLEQMNGRLRSHFPQSFIDSLYPELSKGNAAVADDADEDDDDAEPADPTPVPV